MKKMLFCEISIQDEFYFNRFLINNDYKAKLFVVQK